MLRNKRASTQEDTIRSEREFVKMKVDAEKLKVIYQLTKKKDVMAVETLIDKGFDKETNYENGYTLLHLAALNNQFGVVEVLIKKTPI